MANKLTLNTLRHNRIFFARPCVLNDCFDTSSQLIKAYPQFCKKINWTDLNEIKLDKHAVFSMSQGYRPDNKHLWSLYAGNYTGYSIEFDGEIFDKFLVDNALYLSAVQYVNRPLNLDDPNAHFSIPERDNGYTYAIHDCYSFRDTYVEMSDGSLCLIDQRKAQERLFEYLHLQKEKNIWQIENEARLIIGNIVPKNAKCLKNGYYMTLPQGCISKIYIGKYMKGVFKKRLKKIAKILLAETFEVEPKIINSNWEVEITKV